MCFVLHCLIVSLIDFASMQYLSRRGVIAAAAVLLLWISVGSNVTAQTATTDVSQLTRLFEYLLGTEDEGRRKAIESRIVEERRHLRPQVEEEVSALVQVGEGGESLDLERALDRQRVLVSGLKERLDGYRADLALLKQEEDLYQERQQATSTGAVAGVVTLTKSYPELLARRAVLEERVDVLGQVTEVQESRLESLRADQRVRRFASVGVVLWYVFVILAVFWVERTVRLHFLTRIPKRELRYGAIKLFGFVVYLTLLFWFIQELFSDYPTVLAAFAVVGATAVITLQDVIKGMVGWLIKRGSVVLGQRVMIGEIMGDVIGTGPFHTTLLVVRPPDPSQVSLKGKVVHVPNARLLTELVTNLHSTSDFNRAELRVTIADPSQWKRAKEICEDILSKETDAFVEKATRQVHRRMREFFATEEAPRSVVFTEIVEEGVQFTLCFPVPIGQLRYVTTKVTERILERCAEVGIALAHGSVSPALL